jgi:signal transduction histidine kinase
MEKTANVESPVEKTSHGDAFSAAVESAKLQALYNFAYGLSHEINNPLANIATRAQTLLADEKDPDRRRKLATIVQQAFRAHEMIADLMLFARPPALRPESVDLAKLADTVVAEMQDQAREQSTRLIRTGDPGPLHATLDPRQIAVALKALIQNSLEALKDGGTIEVLSTEYSVPGTADGSTDPIPADRADTPHSALRTPHFLPTPHSEFRIPHFVLSVSDTGPGIPSEIRPHIFDPFFSGREAGRGLGLGLSKAWRIAQLHGGQIAVESQPEGGACVTIVLPANPEVRSPRSELSKS